MIIGNRAYIRVPVENILIPSAGAICYEPSWWVVDADDCVLFTDTYTPHCNTDYDIALRLKSIHDKYGDFTLRHLPMVYLENN